MVSPVDAAPDTLQPQIAQPEITAPDDYEAAALNDGYRQVDPPDENEQDNSELAEPPQHHDSAIAEQDLEDHDDTPDITHRSAERRVEIPEVQIGRVSLHDNVDVGADERETEARIGAGLESNSEESVNDAAAAPQMASFRLPAQTLAGEVEVSTGTADNDGHISGQGPRNEVDDTQLREDGDESPRKSGDPATDIEDPEPETDAEQPPRPPGNGDIPPAADDLPDDEGDTEGGDRPTRAFHMSDVGELPGIIKDDGTARVLTAGEVATRALLVPRGNFVYSGSLAERFGLSEAQVKNLAMTVSEERTLLARRITDETDPGAATRFGYSDRYLDVVETYKVIEEIDRLHDAINEVATEEWGQYLAWGIRAEYHDAVRALGSHLLLNEAVDITGVSRSTLFDRGLPERMEPERGRRGVWVVPVEKLFDRERWIHRGFDQLKSGPRPVQFYTTREVADMLNQKAPSTIRKMIGLNLLPGVSLDAPFRDDTERQHRNVYTRIPAPDAHALRDYWEGNQRKTLRAVVRSFVLDNPHQFTITRGRFEAYAAHLRLAGRLRYKSEVERLLGTSDKFLEHYALGSGKEAFEAIRWNRVTAPSSRRVSEVDARTVRDAVSDVIDRGRKPADVAATYGVSLRTVYNWMKAATHGRI